MIQRYYGKAVGTCAFAVPRTDCRQIDFYRVYAHLGCRNYNRRSHIERTELSLRSHYSRSLLCLLEVACKMRIEVTVNRYIVAHSADFCKPVLQSVLHWIVAGYTAYGSCAQRLQVGKRNYIDYTLESCRKVQVVIIILAFVSCNVIVGNIAAYGYGVRKQILNAYATVVFPSASVFFKVLHSCSLTFNFIVIYACC